MATKHQLSSQSEENSDEEIPQPVKLSRRKQRREKKRKRMEKQAQMEESNPKRAKVQVPEKKKDVIPQDALEVSYIIQDGLRFVKPFAQTLSTHAKKRWFGCKVIDVLLSEFRGRSRDYYLQALKLGLIQVNRKPTRPDQLIKDGDKIYHRLHRHEPPVTAQSIRIVHDGDKFIVVDKPGSLPIHPAGKYRHNTLMYLLAHQTGMRNLYVIHRIDRLTSGIVMFAKTGELADTVSQMIRSNEVEKVYLARVEGVFPEGVVEVDQPILVTTSWQGQCRVDPVNGKPSKTIFERVSTNGVESIVRCLPKTGRTHQIRTHLQWLGFPISNDPLYNPRISSARPAWLVAEDGDEEQDETPPERDESSHNDPADEDFEPATVDIDTLDPQPYCRDCAATFRNPNPDELFIYLHALSYRSSTFHFETEPPAWATLPDPVSN